MELQDIRTIHEVTTGADFNQSSSATSEVNIYLQNGWILLGIHERGWRDESQRSTTVYILGHRDPNPTYYRHHYTRLNTWEEYHKDAPTIQAPEIPF